MPSNQFTRVEKLVGDCEDWQAVTFENSWVNFGGSFAEAAYYKDPFNHVHIKGVVKSGTLDATVFTLPEGYRPSEALIFSTEENGGNSVRLDITTGGAVSTSNAASSVFLTLQVNFRV